jgi:hypothetical protein
VPNDVSLAERIMSRVDVDPATGCWMWTAGKHEKGYGRIVVNGKQMRAHRVSYELFVGPIPEGLQIDHLCRVPGCVNPEHLEPVTSAVNTQRRAPFVTFHAAKTHCKHGHEFTPENTYLLGPEKRWRQCRECAKRRESARTYS